MTWDAIATFTMVAVTFMAANLGALKWLLDRHYDGVRRESSHWDEIERGLYELRASLPLEYVRREDWIRFSGTLDAKLDAMREEMREVKN